MSRKLFQISFSILLLVGMVLGFALKDGALAQANPNMKVEGGLLDQLSAGPANFFVYMTEKADLSGASQLQEKTEKGQYVFDTLVSTADRTQADLRSFLDAQGVEYKSFYIVNAIMVKNGSLDLAQTIAARPDVASINANHTYQLEEPMVNPASPNNPQGVESNISFVGADDVWSAFGVTGEGTVVAGNDTGLYYQHPALIRQYRGCLNPPTCDQIDHNYNWWDATGLYPTVPGDGHGHGTHTTGTMVGDDGGDNQIGMAPGARTIHCKNMTDGGGGDDNTFLTCFQWDLAPWDLNEQNPLPSMAPDSINNSWGYWGGGADQFRDAVDALLAAGIVVEVSAGNEGSGCQTLRSPGDYQEVFTTGSINHAAAWPGTMTGFSSRGPSILDGNYFPDFTAPGENIRSSVPGGGYQGGWSGTSMSGPHVTALIGLIWSANPALRGQIDTTYGIIRDTVSPVTSYVGSCGGDYVTGPNNDWGYGTINAYAAVQLAISFGGAGTLEGTVTDAVTQLPVADATVKAVRQEGGTWTLTTDGDGFYSAAVAAGTFEVTASHPHYMADSASGVVVVEDGTTVQDFALTPRGYVEGYVFDFDNLTPLVGATVSGDDASSTLTDGFGYYQLWLDPGAHVITATMQDYAPEAAQVEIVSGQGTEQDFYLQAAVVFVPTPIEVNVPLGGTLTEPAEITNRQPWGYEFEFRESDKGYSPMLGSKPVVELAPRAPEGNPIIPQGSSSNAAIQPMQSRINQAPILVVSSTDVYQSVEQSLIDLGYAYDYMYGPPWTIIDFSPYEIVIIAMDGGGAEVSDVQALRTNVLDAGKKLIVLGGTCYQPFAQGMNDYIVLNDIYNYCWQITNPPQWTLVDPSHPLADGLPDTWNYGTYGYAGYYQIRVNDPDVETVAINGEGWPAFFRKTTDGDFTWFIDSVYGWYWSEPTDYAMLRQIIFNAINAGGGDVPWLSESPITGTVPAESTLGVDINFDASPAAGVTQPGTYSAELTVRGEPKVVVPVTMFVEAPQDWGRLDGTVASLGYCDNEWLPLEGAVVDISGQTMTATLVTDENGYYATWLEAGEYILTVSAEGNFGDSAVIQVVAQGDVTQDFNLRWDQPCLFSDPLTMSATLDMGQSETQQMTLTNLGAGVGEFTMSDSQSGYTPPPMRQGFLPQAVRPSTPDTTPSSLGRAPNARTLSPVELGKAIAELAGEPAFAVDVYPGYNLVSFNSDDPGGWNVVAGLPNNQYFGGDFVNGDFSTLFVVDYGTNTLYTVDTTTGAVTTIGPSVPSGESWTGLSGAIDGTMYGVASTCSSSTLYTVDLSTGDLTTVGNITNGACVIDIAVTPDGTIYAVDIVDDNLMTIDPNTGEGTDIGYIGFNANYAQGMDYEETSGTLYLAAYSSQGELRIADPATGNTTLVGAFPGGAEVDSLAFATGGGGEALWLYENPESGVIPGFWPQAASAQFTPSSSPNVDLARNSGIAASQQGSDSPVISAPVNPEAVLWDQTSDGYNSIVDQYFPDFGAGVFSADDFTTSEDWSIETIFIDGDSGGLGTLFDADSLNWFIFPDNGGVPNGFPGAGGEVFSFSALPTDPGITISGVDSDEVTLDLVTATGGPVVLQPGTYWIAFFPSLNFSLYGQWFWDTSATTNLSIAQLIDPANLFGQGWTDWTPWTVIDPLTHDGAFRLEGGVYEGDNPAIINVTFDAGMVTQPGTYTGEVKAKTNDPVVKNYTVDVTMVVNAPTDWGQLTGTVTDLGYCDDNPVPLKGASVSIVDGLTVETDADGNYLIWLEAGEYTVNVSKDGYTSASATVVVNEGGAVTVQDFDLRWMVPCLTVDPTSLSTTLDLGESDTQQVTLTNDGAGALNWKVSEANSEYVPQLADEVLVVAWDYTAAAAMEAALADLGQSFVEVDQYTFEAMPVEQLFDYSMVFYAGIPMGTSQNLLMAYLDEGGRLYVSDNDVGWSQGGTPFYMVYLQATYNQDDGGNVLTGEDFMTGLTVDVSADPYPDGFTVGAEGVKLFQWDTSPYAGGDAVERESYKAVYTAFDFQFVSTFEAQVDMMERILSYLGPSDAAWLTEDPVEGAVPADSTTVVDVSFDASVVTQPGYYTVDLKVKSNDSFNNPVVIPVTMFVNGPADWGRVEGVVSSLGYCDVNPVPLEEATVQVVDGPTLITDENGYYSTWLENGTYEVEVSAEGHVGDAVSVVVVAGETAVQDFNLRVVAPCVEVGPTEMEATLTPDTFAVQQLHLFNYGAGDASFKVSEVESGVARFYPATRQGFLPAAVRPKTVDTTPSSLDRAPNAASLSGAELNKALIQLVGESAFAVDVYPGYNLVNFTNDDPGNWTVIAPLPGSAYFGGDFINGDFSTLYVVDYYTNSLYGVDTATGVATLIGPSVPSGESWTGLTGSVDGTMYGVGSTCGSSTLYTVDLNTGALTTVGPITNGPCVIDIAITPDGTMYGVDIVNDNLLEINPETGAGTVIGYIGFNANYAQGMDFEEESGTLYLAAYNVSAYGGELRIADPATGNSTLVGAFPGNAEVDALAFATFISVDIPWLSEDPITGTVGADSVFTVDVTFDATDLAVGHYTGALRVRTGDPNNPTAVIPVMLHVVESRVFYLPLTLKH